jgi:uncharacterized Zn-finger protein
MKEEVYSTTTHVKCQGKSFPEDHPVVYLEIDSEIKSITCPYCSKKFILAK